MARKKKEKKEVLDEFKWEGINRSGTKISGTEKARSDVSIRVELRKQGIKPLKVKRKPKPLMASAPKKITSKEIMTFSRQLATMMTSGVPLVQSFDIIASGHENPSMRSMLNEIKSDIESGTTLANALVKFPQQFDELYCNLVGAGEQSGALETLLHKIAIYQEKTESLKAKIKKAMTYPTAVMAVAMIVTGILLIFVVPTFQELFAGFGAELPAFTQMVINLSQFVQDSWWMMVGGIWAVIYGFMQIKRRSRAFNRKFDRALLGVPAIGPIIHKAAIARFSRTLATMSAAGVPLIEAMTPVAQATGNSLYESAVFKVRDEIATGTPLNKAMAQVGVFPNVAIQMVAIGEESGAIDDMLSKVADMYEEEVDNAVDSISSLIEPMIMSFLGVVVGGLVVSMYLPIFKLGSAI